MLALIVAIPFVLAVLLAFVGWVTRDKTRPRWVPAQGPNRAMRRRERKIKSMVAQEKRRHAHAMRELSRW